MIQLIRASAAVIGIPTATGAAIVLPDLKQPRGVIRDGCYVIA